MRRAEIDGQPRVLVVVRDVSEREIAEQKISTPNAELEQRVRERTAQLQAANNDLESFGYSVSHDLRAPLRAIDGYSRILSEKAGSSLGAEATRLCGEIRENTRAMGRLIDDLLAFSRLGRMDMKRTLVEMVPMVRTVFDELVPAANRTRIEVGATTPQGEISYFIRDNGAGFDPTYTGKLFGVFQRLHSDREYESTGVGLAIVKRVVERHCGRVGAEGAVDRGAAFTFTLPS